MASLEELTAELRPELQEEAGHPRIWWKCVLGKVTGSIKVLRWDSVGLFGEQRAGQCIISDKWSR